MSQVTPALDIVEILSIWSQVTPQAESIEMVQYGYILIPHLLTFSSSFHQPKLTCRDDFNVAISFWTIFSCRLPTPSNAAILRFPMLVHLHAPPKSSSPFAASSSFFYEGNEHDFQQGSLQDVIECTYLRFVDDLDGSMNNGKEYFLFQILSSTHSHII